MPRRDSKAPRKTSKRSATPTKSATSPKRSATPAKRSTSPTSATSKRALTKSSESPATHATVRASRVPREPAALAVATPVVDSGDPASRLFDALRQHTSDDGLTTLLAVIPQQAGRPTLADLRAVQLLARAIEQSLVNGAPPEVWSDFARARNLLLRTDSESAIIVEYVAAFERAVSDWHLRPQARDTIIDSLTFEISELDPKFTYRDSRLVRRLQEGFESTIPPDTNRHRTRGGQRRSAAGIAAEVAVEWKALGAEGKLNERTKRAFAERVRRARESSG